MQKGTYRFFRSVFMASSLRYATKLCKKQKFLFSRWSSKIVLQLKNLGSLHVMNLLIDIPSQLITPVVFPPHLQSIDL